MIKKIVNFSVLKAPEGNRMCYTMYEIDESGNIINDNVKKSFAVLDTELQEHITAIENKLAARENIV